MPLSSSKICPVSGNKRGSNLELYRIIVMILIVAHHYVVNSGLTNLEGPVYAAPMSWRSLFLLIFGAWGKPAINCFVLITGYFMCKSQITLKKLLKLLCEVYFYKILFYAIFILSGYEAFSLKAFLKVLAPITGIAENFTSCYLLFYLTIPFLNILLKNLKEKQHVLLLCLALTIYTLFGGLDGLPIFALEMNYVSWFMVLYFIGAYLRLYPHKIFDNARFWGWAMAVVLVLSALSVVAGAWIGQRLGQPKLAFFFVADCNKPLALAIGVSSFLFFKNLKIPYSRLINSLGASTYGVLLIHSNSHTMRRWLWQDLLQNTAMYNSPLLVVHAVVSVLVIFAVCSAIDYLRIRLLETPFFRLVDKHIDGLVLKYRKIENAICQKLGISQD